MLLSMPRPSRLDEAVEQLQAYYAERGAMPSIQAFAELMGYRSPSSAHDVTKALVLAGFLARDERAGRVSRARLPERDRGSDRPTPRRTSAAASL
jgi:SOS-response transcriptional repressor LexA